jgi:phosphatidylinositol alpha 1,6-mannosyltransferase
MRMRIAIVTESFPPAVNGVANSVVRVAEHLVGRGHAVMVVAPAPSSATRAVSGAHPYPVVRVPSVPVPRYRSFRLGLPLPRLADALVEHAPDVVHLASPFLLGARGVTLAGQLNLPSVAVYQTDVAAYARAYLSWLGAAGASGRVSSDSGGAAGASGRVSSDSGGAAGASGRRGLGRGLGRDLGEAAAWRWLRAIHNGADRTLAPSTAAADDLVAHGVQRVWLWRRGVDLLRFDPAKSNARLRALLAPNGETLVGYVGRLAVEKQVNLLAAVCRLPDVKVVVVGDGPAARDLRRALPGALFLGLRQGEQLARIYASLDIFVHTGAHETFGQSVQEALASGVPVVAPAAGGPLDLVSPGVTGTLVPPGDAAAIAEAVAALAADPTARKEYAEAARASVAARDWAAVGDELVNHYAAVLSGPSLAAAVPAAA